MACAYSLGLGARSLVGWSTRLITGGSGVQVPSGPLLILGLRRRFLEPLWRNGYEGLITGVDY